MATTTNYGFEKPTVGGNEDTWGTLLNENWDSVDTELKAVADHKVPSGGIIMWSGAIGAIPSGWYLCDGDNGTPNLKDRFIVGAGNNYAVGATGGADSVTLDGTQIPSHTHTFSGTTSTDGDHSHGYTYYQGPYNGECCGGYTVANYPQSGTTSTAGNHNHTFSGTTAATGGGSAHENRPPYYALAYIMKA
jgi:microcystin-dependent protein